MSSLKVRLSWKQWLLGVVILIVAIVLVCLVFLGLYKLFSGLPPQVATALLTIIAGGLSAIVTATVTKRSEKRLEIERQIRQQKIPIYESFLPFWFKIVPGKGTSASTMSQEEIVEFLQNFTQQMIAWGSDDVLKAYCQVRKSLVAQANNPGQNGYAPILLIEEMLYAIRRDLGHKNSGLTQGDVLALFINDVDTILPTPAQNGRAGEKTQIVVSA